MNRIDKSPLLCYNKPKGLTIPGDGTHHKKQVNR